MRNISDDIKNKLENRIQTPGNNSDHNMKVIVSRALNSLTDSNGFIVDTIREKEGLGDLGIDIYRPEGKLVRIYEVHNDNNVIKTATREMPALPENEWIEGSIIDNGKLCRIAFDGHWIWSEEIEKYLFASEGDPFLFFTDLSDNLKVQVWEDSTSRVELAQNVVSMSVIRGWKSNNNVESDQGLIATYIKTDGKLYYRNYTYDAVNENYRWEAEREITIIDITDPFVSVSMFRTNDYRLGFVISTDQDEIYWKISVRRWAGLAIRPEVINAEITDFAIARTEIFFSKTYQQETINSLLTSFEIERLYGISPLMISAENLGDGETEENFGLYIKITFDKDIYEIDGNFSNFMISDEDSNSFPPSAIEYISGSTKQILLTCTDFNGAVGEITITYTLETGTIVGEAQQDVDTHTFNFTPTGLIPPVTGPPAAEDAENVEGDDL